MAAQYSTKGRYLKIWAFLSMLLALIILLSSCGGTALTQDQKKYAGSWKAADGSYVQIWENGDGDSQKTNSYVSGSATIKDGSITIGLGPINTTYKITREPEQVNGQWVIGLDGVDYVKQATYQPKKSGSSNKSNSSNSTDSSHKTKPKK